MGNVWPRRKIVEEVEKRFALECVAEIKSEALGPTMVTPTMRLSEASKMVLMNPVVSPVVNALPIAVNGTFPVFTSIPLALASCSCRPAVAISGSVKTTAGTVLAW